MKRRHWPYRMLFLTAVIAWAVWTPGCVSAPQFNADGSPVLDANGKQQTKLVFDWGAAGQVGGAAAPFLGPFGPLVMAGLPLLTLVLNKKKA